MVVVGALRAMKHEHRIRHLAEAVDRHFSYAVPSEPILMSEDWSDIADPDGDEDEGCVPPHHSLDEGAHKHAEE